MPRYIVLVTDVSTWSTGKITAEKNQSSATLLTINPTWTDLRSNLSLCGEKLTNKF